jgi:RNA 2',3'-cyclic 3'-phosphodiesterase
MRGFIALPIPEEVRQRLAEAGKAALRDLAGVRLVRPEAMHVTLVFLGEVAASELPAVRGAMEEAVAGDSAFTASLGPAGQFPPKGRPKVFYVGLHDGARKCTRVYERLHGRLAQRFRLDSRPFTPHITLARVKDPRSVPQATELGVRVEARFPVTQCVLYESTLTPQGARYRPVETVSLSRTGGSDENLEEQH